MKKAIEFLRNKGLQVDDNGLVLSELPINEGGAALLDDLADSCAEENGEWAIDSNGALIFIEY